MKSKVQKIQVAVRVRPLISLELKKNDTETLTVEDNQIIVADPIDKQYEDKIQLDVYHRSREKVYAFDKVYTNHPPEQIYQETAQNLIDPFFQGYNACVFAYGATGTGKTHTMLGNENTLGLINQSLKEIFKKKIEFEQTFDVDIKVSYIEIYNEVLRDLLVERSPKNLDLRDNPSKGVVLANAKIMAVDDTDQIMKLLYKGNERRITEATGANETSSRSHAVFQIFMKMTPLGKIGKVKQINAKLSLIDLAGSERGAKTNNMGIRMQEGAKINRSLLALANCINALGDNKKGVYVNYRDSKLTRLLKDSLGGKSKTVMVVTISPASSQFEETLNTLKYANRAKEIKTKPIKNKKQILSYQVDEYKDVIKGVNEEVQALKTQLLESIKFDKIQKIGKEEKQKIKLSEQELIEDIKFEIIDNFQQRIQIRRALCELAAQQKINEAEIDQGKNVLLHYTLSVSGQLVEKENLEDMKFQNLPPKLERKLLDIKQLKVSINENDLEKKFLEKELVELTKEANSILQEVNQKIKSSSQRKMLELFFEQKISEIRSQELEYNLKMQEKLNYILLNEIKKLKNICDDNHIFVQDDEEDLSSGDEFNKEMNEKFLQKMAEVQQEYNFKKQTRVKSQQKLNQKAMKQDVKQALNAVDSLKNLQSKSKNQQFKIRK